MPSNTLTKEENPLVRWPVITASCSHHFQRQPAVNFFRKKSGLDSFIGLKFLQAVNNRHLQYENPTNEQTTP